METVKWPIITYGGKKITSAEIVDDRLRLQFDNLPVLELWDDGQSCCEARYMTTDDDLSDLVGQSLVSIESVEAEPLEDKYGDTHEQAFVKIQGDRSAITLVTHNEHNGYYGGFSLRVEEMAWKPN
jgi:hypothetical protein